MLAHKTSMTGNNIDLNALAEIQRTQMGILAEFIRICDKYNLKYFLAEGSLLGAIRHQGMIPWDDDIDVCLFRDDYETFIRIAEKEIQSPYKIQNYKSDSGYIDYISGVVHTGKKVQTSYRKENTTINLWIDIFVIDGMPTNKVKHFIHKYDLLFHKLLVMWSDLDHYCVRGRKRPLYERILIKLCEIFHFERVINTKWALDRMDRCMKKVPSKNDGLVINFMSEYKWRTEFPSEYYGDGRMVPFGDLIVRVPNKSEEILSSTYGDYMKLPPEDQRYKHSLTLL